jgi:hypothetical protein
MYNVILISQRRMLKISSVTLLQGALRPILEFKFLLDLEHICLETAYFRKTNIQILPIKFPKLFIYIYI